MKKGFTLIELMIVVCIVSILGVLGISAAKGLSSSGDSSKQVATLQSMGFSDIRITGTAWMGCSESDSTFMNKHFVAKNVKEQTVSGLVCCGIWKGCTVRF